MGERGRNWDDCNSIVSKIYFLKKEVIIIIYVETKNVVDFRGVKSSQILMINTYQPQM